MRRQYPAIFTGGLNHNRARPKYQTKTNKTCVQVPAQCQTKRVHVALDANDCQILACKPHEPRASAPLQWEWPVIK